MRLISLLINLLLPSHMSVLSHHLHPPAGYIVMKKGNSQMKINFRTFTASGGWSGEVLVPGGTARHGKISHGPLNDVLKAHGVKQITDNIPSRNKAFTE